jgi:hypothetical protein
VLVIAIERRRARQLGCDRRESHLDVERAQQLAVAGARMRDADRLER